MDKSQIAELQRVFTTRLETLEHLIAIGERHFPGADFMDKRLAEDMLPFGAQVAFACNAPRGFSQWCAGQSVENLPPTDIQTIEQARAAIAQTRAMVMAIAVDDGKLDETKRVGLGPGRFCNLSGRQYVADYVLANLYFHVTAAYAILRTHGAPLGKSDFLCFLAPYVRQE